MSSLADLEKLIKSIAASSEVLDFIKATMPVHAYTVSAENYTRLAEVLATNTIGVRSAINTIFIEGTEYTKGIRADWAAISNLAESGIVGEIRTDSTLTAVYARLAVLSHSIANSAKEITEKTGIRNDLVHGLLVNTLAFNQLSNARIHYNIDSSVASSNTKATYTVDISASTNMPSNSALYTLAKKAEIAGINKLGDILASNTSAIGLNALSDRFLESAVREFQGNVSPNSIVVELNDFKTSAKAVVSSAFKEALKRVRNVAEFIDRLISSNISPQRTTLFNQDEESKQVNNLQPAASSADLKSILNTALRAAIERNMAPSDVPTNRRYLRYRTGRFAESAKVVSVAPSPTGKLTNIEYTYLKNPYKSLYTKKGKYAGSGIGLFFSARGRDVQYLIETSIRDIAKNLISNKLSIKPI